MAKGQIVKLLKETVCKVLDITPKQLVGESRNQRFVEGRKMFSCLIRKIIPDITYQQIGMHINRNHASILNLKTKHEWDYEHIFEYAKLYDRVYSLFMDKYMKLDDKLDIEVRLRKYDINQEKKMNEILNRLENLTIENQVLQEENTRLRKKFDKFKKFINYETDILSTR